VVGDSSCHATLAPPGHGKDDGMMRDLGPQHFECSQCGARVLVTFSAEPPVITVEASPAGTERIVTISDREIHRCSAPES
jgi:hypothetical protein